MEGRGRGGRGGRKKGVGKGIINVIFCTCTQIITSGSFTYSDQTSRELADMALQGIKLLTSWTTAVMELVRCVGGKGVQGENVDGEGCGWEGCGWEGCGWEGCGWEGLDERDVDGRDVDGRDVDGRDVDGRVWMGGVWMRGVWMGGM